MGVIRLAVPLLVLAFLAGLSWQRRRPGPPSAVLGIARRHYATIRVDSAAGRGTRMRGLFPLAPVHR